MSFSNHTFASLRVSFFGGSIDFTGLILACGESLAACEKTKDAGVKEFELEADTATGRAKLPQATFETGSSVPH